ncbi:MAG: ACT domain-containing protein [Clostridia bacterium]|nr:ACT domain-containing protein [Clostridia bacterium]
MKETKNYYIIDKSVLPEVFIKVMEVKNLLESGREKTVQEAVNKVGISRSAFYKYRDAIFPLYEHSRGKNVTFSANVDNRAGLLSTLLNAIANAGANILTINQTIPINGIANVTITVETQDINTDMGEFIDKMNEIEGVRSLKIIARE